MKAAIKRLGKTLVEQVGYHVFAKSLFGFDAMADVRGLPGFRAAPMVFDVGACTGQFAVEVRQAMPGARIHCFEADPDTHSRLVTAVRDCADIIPVPLGLGEAPGWLDFRANAEPATSSFLPAATHGHPSVPATLTECRVVKRVRVGRLDDYAEEHGIDRIDLLKSDTQGYELRVLRGASRLLNKGRVKAVFCEVFFKEFYVGQDYFHEIHAFMLQHGMGFSGLYGPCRDKQTGELLWADALYVNPSIT